MTEMQTRRMDKWLDKLFEIQSKINQVTELLNEKPNEKHLKTKKLLDWQKVEAIKRIRRIDPGFIEPGVSSEQYIGVLGTVHPNVHIQINRSKLTVKQEFESVRFFVRQNHIVMEKIQMSDFKDIIES